MLIVLRLDKAALRTWRHQLLNRLSRLPGVEVGVIWGEEGEQTPRCIELLFALERMLNGIPEGGSASPASEASFAPYVVDPQAKPDLVLDFCGSGDSNAAPTWRVTFDGLFGEPPALSALLAGRSPIVEIVEATTGRSIASARPGSENVGVIVAAFEDCLDRTTTLLLAAINGAATAPSFEEMASARAGCAITAKVAARSLSRFVKHRLYRLCCRAPHWRVGWRFVDGPDVIDLARHPQHGWKTLADDGFHFFADPFPLVVGERSYVFVEDYDHRRGRGVISAVEFDDRGPIGSPQEVLATDGHLSYPFVFEHDGDIWMVPESSGRRAIDLFRATEFPGGWQLEATLVADVEASDATLFQNRDRWWMMATVRDEVGSFSDALHLWSATSLFGPWIAHRHNPVLVDIAAARPAGRVVRRDGRLVRPVQDGRRGYGAALALAEITRLDDAAFEQKVFASLGPGPLWPGRRLHTLNWAGRLECIDGSAISFRLKSRLRTRIVSRGVV